MSCITFSKFGRHGRLGNQLFQYAACLGFAVKYNVPLSLPDWQYSQYFDGEFPAYKLPQYPKKVKEHAYHYTPEAYVNLPWQREDINLLGYFQSEKYWQHCEDVVRDRLKFKKEFIEKVRNPYKEVFNKTTIAISIRRGDYIGNKNYVTLPPTYYILALYEHFPNWKDYNLLFFSDDPDYCKVHFQCLPNAYFVDNRFDNNNKARYFDLNESAMEQLCLMAQCDHYILANSSFSWWGAYLGEHEESKVVYPAHYFDGQMAAGNSTKDLWPDRWVKFDHLDRDGNLKKIDLKNVTFTIPVSFDHSDRKQNLELNVCLLQRQFETNIIVGEQGKTEFAYMQQYCSYTFFEGEYFHRTKYLNEMCKMAKTEIVANWDADIIVPPMQLLWTVEQLRAGADFVYPYDGRFARVPRNPWFRKIESSLDIGVVGRTVFNGMKEGDLTSVGGAILFRKASFLEAGGENEGYISYGNEDYERWHRFRLLGYDVQRTNGVIYHLDHWVGVNSTNKHKHGQDNKKLWAKIEPMTKEELRAFVETWPWKT